MLSLKSVVRLHLFMGGAEVIFADVNSYMKNFSYYHIDHIHFENKAKIEIARFMKNYI